MPTENEEKVFTEDHLLVRAHAHLLVQYNKVLEDTVRQYVSDTPKNIKDLILVCIHSDSRCWKCLLESLPNQNKNIFVQEGNTMFTFKLVVTDALVCAEIENTYPDFAMDVWVTEEHAMRTFIMSDNTCIFCHTTPTPLVQ